MVTLMIVRPDKKKVIVSRPLKIEKVMRACDLYFNFLSFLQGKIEILNLTLHFGTFDLTLDLDQRI